MHGLQPNGGDAIFLRRRSRGTNDLPRGWVGDVERCTIACGAPLAADEKGGEWEGHG